MFFVEKGGILVMSTRKAFQLLSLVLLLGTIALTVFITNEQRRSSSASATAFPHVSGIQLIDPSGHPFLLRGAQIESAFSNAHGWQRNNNVTNILNSAVFNEMSKNWHMNAIRLPLSNWIYSADPKHYLALLDQVVQEANQAGLYAILNLHDDDQAGSPYGADANVPKPESITFWKVFAAHYASNPMVIFDAFNEPHYLDGNNWLNGGGTVTGSTGKTAPIVGMQALVNTIRAAGAKQIIVIGGVKYPLIYARKSKVELRINDPNIVYTKHWYREIASGDPASWDASFGYFKGRYPLFLGEWALLPNPIDNAPYRCQGATMQNANQKVINFLKYMDQNQMSWTAWQFDINHLILNRTTFTPTRLDDPNHPWTCPSHNAAAGMGTVLKQHLLSL